MINYYLTNNQNDKALTVADAAYRKFPASYVIGMLKARALILNKKYADADKLLSSIEVLPNEGATDRPPVVQGNEADAGNRQHEVWQL